MPGRILPGKTRFSWGEGGGFLVMRSQTEHPDFPDGIAIFASDRVLRTITMCWFDERGISRLCPVLVGKRWMEWRHDDPTFMQRLTITADGSGQRMTSRGKMAIGGEAWGEDLSQVFTRR